ncbi:hypothetical protein KPH14_008172 [Odynerus spinipes]|uniref:Retropepsins domain-containing protein n=1 Tax=Odynerus spinipes TaxID=1348599 RepID=A0AAD9RDS3_9HYME|nr:hypothetical protein KPH14_008172 [Odynerus spinipes]
MPLEIGLRRLRNLGKLFSRNFILFQLKCVLKINGLRGVNFADSNAVTQALTQLDLAQEDYERQKESRYQSNRGNGNRVNSLRFGQFERRDFGGGENTRYKFTRNGGRNTHHWYGRRSNQDRCNIHNYREPQTGASYYVTDKNRDHGRGSMPLPDVRFPPPRINHNDSQVGNRVVNGEQKDLNGEIEGNVVESTALQNRATYKPSPYIKLTLDEKSVEALVDTGSQVTCVSERLYDILKQHSHVKELPVANARVYTALRQKAVTIKRQIFIPMIIDEVRYDQVFLVVPYLSSECILGNDWLHENKVNINYEKKLIYVKGKPLNSALVTFEREESEELNTTQNDQENHIQIIRVVNEAEKGSDVDGKNSDVELNVLDVSDSDKDCEVRDGSEEDAQLENNLVEADSYCIGKETESDKVFAEDYYSIARKLMRLEEEETTSILNLIVKYKKIFSDKPGLTTIYEHEIKVKSSKLTSHHSYPVPIYLREMVREEIKAMMQAGIIERGSGPYCNPLRIVKGKQYYPTYFVWIVHK